MNPNFSIGDAVAITSSIIVALAAYFGTIRAIDNRIAVLNTRIEVMRAEIAPLVKWWNRMAENQASKLFLKTRASDTGAE